MYHYAYMHFVCLRKYIYDIYKLCLHYTICLIVIHSNLVNSYFINLKSSISLKKFPVPRISYLNNVKNSNIWRITRSSNFIEIGDTDYSCMYVHLLFKIKSLIFLLLISSLCNWLTTR